MKTNKSGLLILAFCVASIPAFGEVYLNRKIIDCENKIWVYQKINLEGEGLSLGWDYQNEYGSCFKLDPGPPFIIEDEISILNKLDPQTGKIQLLGNLLINSQNPPEEREEDPFTINFDMHTYGVGILKTDGNIQLIGTEKQPIQFTGRVNFSKRFTGNPAATIFMRYCAFTPGEKGSPILLSEGNTQLDHCTFSGFGSAFRLILDFQPQTASSYDFTMTNCTFSYNAPSGNDLIGAACLVGITSARTVVLENNTFHHNQLNAGRSPTLVNVASAVNLNRITGNTASNNTVNSLLLSNIIPSALAGTSALTDIYLASSQELPFLILRLEVPENHLAIIAPGSVIKLGSHSFSSERTVLVRGNLMAEGAVFTKRSDDEIGGDTDLDPFSPATSWGGMNGGIRIDPEGTAELKGCTFRYGFLPVYAIGQITIDSCVFWNSRREALYFLGNGDHQYTITNTLIEATQRDGSSFGNGISFNTRDGANLSITLSKVSILNNRGRGFTQGLLGKGSFDIRIDHCVIAANGSDGLYISRNNSRQVDITNSILAVNGGRGVNQGETGPNTDTTRLHLENNLIIGNATGLWKLGGHLRMINNTVACNSGVGLGYQRLSGRELFLANNLFYRNGGGHLAAENYGTENLTQNGFWESLEHDPFFLPFSSGTVKTIPQLWALGGTYTTNLYLNPLFVPTEAGLVQNVLFDDAHSRTIILTTAGAFFPGTSPGVLIRNSKQVNTWFYLEKSTPDSLILLGDSHNRWEIGDTIILFNPRLYYNSPLLDLGLTPYPGTQWTDLDGDPRSVDGNGDGLKASDIGADEVTAGTWQQSDADGVPDQEEMGPQGNNTNYDGNNDGFPDYLQANAVSLYSYDRKHYLGLATSAALHFSNVVAQDNPFSLMLPQEIELPFGFLTFTLFGNERSLPWLASITLPGAFLAGSVTQYGTTATDPQPHWFTLDFDGQTGAQWAANRITLTLQDGARGDDDGQLNNQIHFTGAPNLRPTSLSRRLTTPLALQVYPNPTIDNMHVTLNWPSPANMHLVITDALGRTQSVVAAGWYAPGQYTFSWDSRTLPGGQYYLCIWKEGTMVGCQSFVVTR